jgi:carbonic anhydrase
MIRFLLGFIASFYFIWGMDAQQPFSALTSYPKSNQQILLDETLNFARGHQEFRDLYFQQNEADFIRLIKEGQNPKILFIGCSDSRVVPELILNARPGDIFVIRLAGNFVAPYLAQSIDGVAATLQYALEVLNIPHIIVCGHSHCGAVKGLFQDLDPKLGVLQRWLKLGEEAKQITLQIAKLSTPKEDLYVTAEEINVLVQLEHLMTFPFVRSRVNEGKLGLHGWYFDIETGKIWYYNTQQNRFLPLMEKYEEAVKMR